MKKISIFFFIILFPLNLIAKDYYCSLTWERKNMGEWYKSEGSQVIIFTINNLFNTAKIELANGIVNKLNWIKDTKLKVWVGNDHNEFTFLLRDKLLLAKILNDHPQYFDLKDYEYLYKCEDF